MPNESEAAAYATTSATDFYEILSISIDAPASALRKAFRKASLKWHPDKNPSPEAAAKFHELTTAYDVLADPATKAAYDAARQARLAKKRRSEAFDLHRRQMQADLEGREAGAKRARTDADDEEERFRAQLARLQEEGARLRHRREEAVRRAAEEEAAAAAAGARAEEAVELGESRFSELDRTVSVRWRRKGGGENVDAEELRRLFGRFGGVQDTVVTTRDGGKEKDKERKTLAALVVFDSVVGAHAAVLDALSDDEFKLFKAVSWAGGKAPDLSALPKTAAAQEPMKEDHKQKSEKPAEEPPRASKMGWVPPTSTTNANGAKKAPSFASFSSKAAGKIPQGSSFSTSAADSADYESITLMRMRDAERRRMEAELKAQDEAEPEP